VATPLTTLLPKDQFVCHQDVQLSFNKLKQLMTEALVLAMIDFSIPFILESDASGFATGVVLLQNSYPITFYSKNFCK